MLDTEPGAPANRVGADYCAAFSAGLLDPDLPAPGGISGPRGKAAARRYNVYRNNVTVSLIEALASIYPIVQRVTGPDFFRAMARFHVRANPPASLLLFEYGREFSDFIAQYEYAQTHPWLADLARIERAWLDCYHAPDAHPLRAECLAGIAADRLAFLVFVPHPAVRIIRSDFPVVSILTANSNENSSGPIESSGAQDALVTRPGADVIVRHLPPGGAIFLARLIEGQALGPAVSAALAAAPDFDLAANIAGMIDAGVFTAVKDEDQT